MKAVLDIGCGNNKVPGAVGVDFINLDSVDVVHDLEVFPYPFADNTFDEVHCHHILEHITNLVGLMKEIHRISKDSARIFITGPHCTCNKVVWIDPTHKRGLSIEMFKSYFSPTGSWGYYSNICLNTVYVRLNYTIKNSQTRIPGLLVKTLNLLANMNSTSQQLCERIWAYWFGGFEELELTLEVKK